MDNGYELLTPHTHWKFNNGLDADGNVDEKLTPDKALGSWTFDSDQQVGESDVGLKFSVSESANLLPIDKTDDANIPEALKESVVEGNPNGIYISFSGTTNDATITVVDEAVTAAQLIFTDTAAAESMFLSDTGLHMVGFTEDDTVTVTQYRANGTDTTYYRLKELSGKDVDGFELLKVSETDVWELNTDNDDSLKREWTYKNETYGMTLTADTEANLHAHTSGRPLNLEVLAPNTSTDTATIKVNKDSDSFTLGAAYLDITTNNVGSGASIHVIGYDSDTMLHVNDGTEDGRTYRLANMDGNTETRELLAYNENWRYYDCDVKLTDISGGTEADTYKAGSWLYSRNFTVGEENHTFYLKLDSDVALRGTDKNGNFLTLGKKSSGSSSSTGMAFADANGAPIGVTVAGGSFDGLTITFDAERLNIQSYNEDTKTTDTNLFSHITLGSDTAIGKDGIHILGFASDTTFKVGESDVKLAELDGDTGNGLELLNVNNNGWTRIANGWEYDSDGVAFTVANTLSSDENGAPIGITVNGGKAGRTSNYSDTIVIDNSTITSPDQIVFANGTRAGSSTGIHISLLSGAEEGWADASFSFASSTSSASTLDNRTYYMKELDGETDTGYELLIANTKGWSLSVDKDAKRTWTYTHTNGTKGQNLTFQVDPKDGHGAGQGLNADTDTGLPIGVTVEAKTINGTGNQAVVGYWLTFGDTDSSVGEALGVDSDMVKFTTLNTGVNGIHVKGLFDSDNYVYTSETNKMVVLGEGDDAKRYYFADVSTIASAAGFQELLQHNENDWHRYETYWAYNNKDIELSFRIDSEGNVPVLQADPSVDNEGKPLGVTVTSSTDDRDYVTSKSITINSSTAVASKLIFDSENTAVDMLHISLSGAANTATTEFTFRTYGADGAGDTDTTYYIVDTDHQTNGSEFYKKDVDSEAGIWFRTSAGWNYFTSGENITSSTFLSSNNGASLAFQVSINGGDTERRDDQGYSGGDAGSEKPVGIDVETDTGIITLSNDSPFDVENIFLYQGHFDSGITVSGSDSPQLEFGKLHFKGNFAEGETIRSYNGSASNTNRTYTTYTLYNADADTSNGLELTFNGWTTYTSDSTTHYAYVHGTETEISSNIGLVLRGSETVFRPATTTQPSIAGVSVDEESHSISLQSSTTPTTGFVLKELTSENFHVLNFSDVGMITTDTEINIGSNTYKFKDVDGDPNTGFELVSSDGNWAKYDIGTKAEYRFVGTNSETVLLTVNGGANDQDGNNDFQPNFIYDISYDSSNGLSLTLNSDPGKSSTVRFISGMNLDTDNKKVAVTLRESSTAYTLQFAEMSGSNYAYQVLSTTTTVSSQLPVDSAEAWDGYDVEDLINYDNGAAFDSDLDSILETKEIGTAESFNLADPSDLLTGVATNDKSLDALTKAARHKARK